MPDHDVVLNHGAVLAAAVAKFALGSIWYTFLFGKTWAKLSGVKMSKNMPMGKPLAVDFVAGVVYAYGLAVVADWHGGLGQWKEGLCVGVLVGLAFNATMLLATNVWSKKPLKLFFIDASYQVLMSTVMGVVITALTKAPEVVPPAV